MKIYFTNHSIQRYKDRILYTKKINTDEINDNQIKKMIRNDIQIKYIKDKIFIDDMMFIFTHNHIEFRFEKSTDRKGWVLLTVIKYDRMFPHDEPIFEEYLKDTKQKSGIRTAIKLRKLQKEEFENENKKIYNLNDD